MKHPALLLLCFSLAITQLCLVTPAEAKRKAKYKSSVPAVTTVVKDRSVTPSVNPVPTSQNNLQEPTSQPNTQTPKSSDDLGLLEKEDSLPVEKKDNRRELDKTVDSVRGVNSDIKKGTDAVKDTTNTC
jgi:hypothetical protein